MVSNIRMPEEDWLQVKAAASDLGMSINEYLNQIAFDFVKMKFFGYKEPVKRKNNIKKSKSFKELIEFAKTPYKNKPMGWSSDDEAIYGI